MFQLKKQPLGLFYPIDYQGLFLTVKSIASHPLSYENAITLSLMIFTSLLNGMRPFYDLPNETKKCVLVR